MTRKIDENFTIHYPSLKYFSQLAYVDPRVDSKGRRVNFEKEGCFNGQEGHYVMYEDDNLPGKFIAVHIPSALTEDDEEGPGINVVAVDRNALLCANRLKYRMKKENRSQVKEARRPVLESTGILDKEDITYTLRNNTTTRSVPSVKSLNKHKLVVKGGMLSDPMLDDWVDALNAIYKEDGITFKFSGRKDGAMSGVYFWEFDIHGA